jgi:hypothetical protein
VLHSIEMISDLLINNYIIHVAEGRQRSPKPGRPMRVHPELKPRALSEQRIRRHLHWAE